MTTKREHDAIVLGLGGIGSAAIFWLASRGADVLAVEQFEEGHGRGSSEDHSRIIRLSYHNRGYVELAKKAWEAWEAVEVASGDQLTIRTGGLDLAPSGGAIDIGGYRQALGEAGVQFDELDSDAIMRRWPQFRLPQDVTGIYHEEAGLVMATRANQAHRRLARANGAELVTRAPVESIRETADGVEVLVAGASHRAGQLVIAAGPWTNRVLALIGRHLPLQVTLEQVLYLDSHDLEAFHPRRFPVWIWLDEPCFYGLPVFGEPAVKIGWDRCQVVTDSDRRPLDPDPATSLAMTSFADAYLPTAHRGIHSAKTCLYTLTPDRDFIIDRLPGSDRISLAVGAGHAFKFASLIGRLLADIATGRPPGVDLTPFRADRELLTMENPPRVTMV